jgi:hypothetical protein
MSLHIYIITLTVGKKSRAMRAMKPQQGFRNYDEHINDFAYHLHTIGCEYGIIAVGAHRFVRNAN